MKGRGKFSADIVGLAKTDNAPKATQAKAIVRHNVLEAVGLQSHVFDAFAGDGHMYRAVWEQAGSCVSCDTRMFMDDRVAFVADNRRVLRAIDLERFGVFDFDAYGSPWEQIYILAARRRLLPDQLFGLVLTDGQALKLKMGGMAKALSILSGVPNQAGLARMQDEIMDRALLKVAGMMGATIKQRWQAVGKTGSRMMYIGVVLKGNAA